MVQPIKKTGTYQKPRSKTIKKKVSPSKDKRLPKSPKVKRAYKWHPAYGTSKLETRFASEFLDKLGIKYIYQYEAKSIGRFFDFMLLGNENAPHKKCLLEVDGQYWHSDPRLYEENELNAVQRKNKRVDEIKNKYCSMNGITLIRVSEYDIKHSPDKVLNWLKEILKDYINI